MMEAMTMPAPASVSGHQAEELAPLQGSAKVPGGGRLLRVGCALLPKKVSRYLTPTMRAFALSQGLELTEVDTRRSLLEQGPFDAIIHKLRPDEEWERNLKAYAKQHPNVTIVDRIDAIRTLQNRSTMLGPLYGPGVLLHQGQDGAEQQQQQQPAVRVQAPHQVEIPEGTTPKQAAALLAQAGLHPPLLVKPLWTDGREGSHGLAVLHEVHTLDRLLSGQVSSELQPPLVVQQFVDHGGVLFKVYVIGDRTVVSARPSLGDTHLGHAAREGVVALPRISCKSATDLRGQDSGVDSGGDSGGGLASPAVPGLDCRSSSNGGAVTPATSAAAAEAAAAFVQPPPEWATHALAGFLRDQLGLQLFNFDLICPLPTQQAQLAASSRDGDDVVHVVGEEEDCEVGDGPQAQGPQAHPQAEWLYYVVDVNYFPGVDKIPNFEAMFVAFLKDACQGWSRHGSGCNDRRLPLA